MKNKRRILFYIASILLILNILIIVYITSFNLNAFNEPFYKKYNIYSKFPNKNIEGINSDVLSYLKNKKDNLDGEFFDKKEKSHLADVKMIIQKMNIIYYSTLVISLLLLILIFLLGKKDFSKKFGKILFFSGLSALLPIILLLILITFGFDKTFTIFHTLFFIGDSWLFSPTDNITNLYTVEFFYDISKNIFLFLILIYSIKM